MELSENKCFDEYFYNEKILIDELYNGNIDNVEIIYSEFTYKDMNLVRTVKPYYPSDNTKLFDEFAKLGEKVHNSLINLDTKSFNSCAVDWLKKYGGLNFYEGCYIYPLIYKSIMAFILNKLYKMCLRDEKESKKALKSFLCIADDFISVNLEFDLTPKAQDRIFKHFHGSFPEEWKKDLLKFIDFSLPVDGDIRMLNNDDSVEYYKKLALLYMSKVSIRILEQYPIGFYTNFPEEVAGKNWETENYAGFFIETSPKFINLEQIIFNQFLERLKHEPDKRRCSYCGITTIDSYQKDKTGKSRKTRFNKKYCSDSCRAMASRKRNTK